MWYSGRFFGRTFRPPSIGNPPMREMTQDELDRFVDACHRAGAYGLAPYSSGNMSWRLGEDHMAVTASGSWLGELRPDHVAVCRLADGTTANGVKPTCEARFHQGALLARPDVNVVLHFQSPAATAVACMKRPALDFNVIVEVPYYIGEPAWVDYHAPGSPELADAVIRAMRGHDLAILKNHGQVTVGASFDDAIQRAGFFELACGILISGRTVSSIPPAAVDALREAARGKGSV